MRKAEQQGRIKLILKEFDIERDKEQDLTNQDLWSEIFTLIDSGNWMVIVSPPCNTFSRARFQFAHFPGPKPLRNRTWPKGFPWLSNKQKQQVDEANLFVLNCVEACRRAVNSCGHFLLEHPEDLGAVHGESPGTIWQWDEVLDLLSFRNVRTVALHQCQFGADTPKPTRLMTSLPILDSRCYFALPQIDASGNYQGPLPRDCGHVHQ